MIDRIRNLPELARLIAMPPYVLRRYVSASEKSYKVFRLAKSSGKGFRTIAAPNRGLKGIQKWILYFLISDVPLHPASTAFSPGDSVAKNAAMHVGKDFVFNMDICNFFGSVSKKRVFRLYREIGCNLVLANILTHLTTYKGCLPQGAPTSPSLANLAARDLDKRLAGFCRRRGWTYSRYADDITISGKGDVSRREEETIKEILRDEGFEPNLGKFRIIRKGDCQLVTGLCVNHAVSVPRRTRQRLRAIFYQASLAPERFHHRVSELQGYVSFLESIHGATSATERYKEVLKTLPK